MELTIVYFEPLSVALNFLVHFAHPTVLQVTSL